MHPTLCSAAQYAAIKAMACRTGVYLQVINRRKSKHGGPGTSVGCLDHQEPVCIVVFDPASSQTTQPPAVEKINPISRPLNWSRLSASRSELNGVKVV